MFDHALKQGDLKGTIEIPNLLFCTLAVVVEGIAGSSNTSGSLGLLLLMVVLLK